MQIENAFIYFFYFFYFVLGVVLCCYIAQCSCSVHIVSIHICVDYTLALTVSFSKLALMAPMTALP